MDMHTLMEDAFQKSQTNIQIPERSQEELQWSTSVILECDNCNVFSLKGLQTLYKFEQQITSHPDYTKYCLASIDSPQCAPDQLVSPTLLVQRILNKTPDQLTEQDVQSLQNIIFSNEIAYTQSKFMFGKEFTSTNRKTQLIRSYIRFGSPIKVKNDLKNDKFDDREDQIKEFNKFCQFMIDIRDKQNNLPEGFKILTYSTQMEQLELEKVIDNDFLWATASIMFVYIYITIHLKSLFLSTTAMLQILISFPISQVIFTLIFGITHFSSLNLLAIFIILGIAADDIFVFVDAWRQTNQYQQITQEKDKQKRLNLRMAITFRRASWAMLATSSTTSAAFLATGFSTIMPISSFGFYASILVPVNFLLVILCFPAILIISETKFENTGLLFCIKKQKKSVHPLQKQSSTETQQSAISTNISTTIDMLSSKSSTSSNNNNNKKQQDQKSSKIELFFANKFSPFINKFKLLILLIFIIWITIATYFSLQLSAITKPEKFLPENHTSQLAKDLSFSAFHKQAFSDTNIILYQFWGVQSLNNENTSRWDPEDLGSITWDPSFDLSFEKNQQYFYNYCLNLKESSLVLDKQVESFIFDFKNFAENISQIKQFPVPQPQFLQALKEFTQTTIGAYYFNSNKIGLIDNQLKYIQIKVASIGTPFKPYKELNPLYEKWQNFIQQQNLNSPKGLNNSKQTARLNWASMVTELAFVSNAKQGMIISMSFSLIILLATTLNIIISIISLISIAGIITSVISIMKFFNWEFGTAESITTIIMIGLSIDYVVHLANHYVESVYSDRYNKTKQSLKDIGISILSGALTTAGSGLFLLFGKVVIFTKFGILILSTIFFSLMFSLFFFSSLMLLIGPENDCGSIKQLLPFFKITKKKQTLQLQQEQQQYKKQNIENNDLNQNNNENQICQVQQID